MFDLKKFRKDKKLTQNDIAFIFNCSQANVASIEKEQKDLTEVQMQILTDRYGDISDYNVLFSVDDTTKEKRSPNHWEDLINMYHESNKELIELLKKEKEEKEKLLETINILTQALADRKAV